MEPTSNNHDEDLQKAERIAYLIAGHIRETLTPKEADELDDWVSESDENLELFEKLTDEENIELGIQKYLQIEKEKAGALSGVKQAVGLKRKTTIRKILPYLVAASVIIIAVSIYMIKTGTSGLIIEKPIVENGAGDIAPGSTKAVLTLSDGRTIILDSTGNGIIAEDGGVKVTKQNGGELSYHSSDANVLTFHTLSTPRGGRYNLTLPDGSKVWLNAESSLRYPITFTGTDRLVELRGEAYFEVAKKEASSFSVKIISANGAGETVRVLGTHFNINSYADEGTVITTLLEGSIEIEKNGKTKLLSPGEQALTSTDIKVIKTDVNEAVAWKEGKFLFRDATVRSIGEQIKRWYDVDVTYEGNITQKFNTEMSRNLPLLKLLDALEGTMQVHFTLDGKKLIIKP
jgi:ferric-dicitrate binding protein FerR (iron transport regulator)